MNVFISPFNLNTKRIACIACFMLLSACAPNPVKETSNTTEKVMTAAQLKTYLEDTNALAPELRATRQIFAAKQLFKQNDVSWSHSIVDEVQASTLNNNDYVDLMLLRGKIATAEGEPYLAQRYLFDERLPSLFNIAEQNTIIELLDLRATSLHNNADYSLAVDERILLSQKIIDDEIHSQFNHDLIWESLAEIPTDTLFKRAKTEKEAVKQGWFSLAALSKSNGANFRKQILDINNWRTIWPAHPANKWLPADLQLILQLADSQAANIAVLLPLTGKLINASTAIKDGIMAAYYDDVSTNLPVPALRFYDTNNTDINQLYDLAVSEGAELIIGPLLKENVTALASRQLLAVPTLALNNIDETPETPETTETTETTETAETAETASTEILLQHQTLFQFGLAVESEAIQVAQKAWQDGHRYALVISPNTSWGARGAQSFRTAWQSLGGEIIDMKHYSNQRDYSKLIEASVAVNESKARHKSLRRTLGTPLEFEPRRRKDVDFIFLLSNAPNAKQLKPLLAYHYAGDIPTYSTSHVFNGRNTSGLKDLNGIHFSSLPWYFDESSIEKRAISSYSSNTPSLQSLYAMGVDAYHIYPRLDQLRKISQARFYGQTGKLSVNDKNVIIRSQPWAQVRGGKATELKNTAQQSRDI